MQFSEFSRTQKGNVTTFYNNIPIENVGSIKYYTEIVNGKFEKEFKWSFNNEYWSSWEKLTQESISRVQTFSNYFLFLQIRYFNGTHGAEIDSFTLHYDEGDAINCVSCDGQFERSLAEDIKQKDASAMLTHEVIQGYKLDTIKNENILKDKSTANYLNRAKHIKTIPINSITNLEDVINQINHKIGNLDASALDVFYMSVDISSGYIYIYK